MATSHVDVPRSTRLILRTVTEGTNTRGDLNDGWAPLERPCMADDVVQRDLKTPREISDSAASNDSAPSKCGGNLSQ